MAGPGHGNSFGDIVSIAHDGFLFRAFRTIAHTSDPFKRMSTGLDIVHQIRASTRYVSYKDIKQVVTDLKKIYTAMTLDEAENNLLVFAERWRGKYPSCVKSWEDNWKFQRPFLNILMEIRKITNIIEGLNRQFRQITKNKPSFTNDDSLRRMLYRASQRIMKHWHARCQNWDLVLSQLELIFSLWAAG